MSPSGITPGGATTPAPAVIMPSPAHGRPDVGTRAECSLLGRRWLWLALGISLFLSLPYLIAVQDFFASDDWAHLNFNQGIPPWQVWRYFSPRVVWFYRPLQALQFGWLYHTAGLHPLAYNLCLWIMHLGVCVLVFVLVSHLTCRPTALLTTALFAGQWVYIDVMLWRSNFNTLHWALLTLGLCVLFLRYLESRRLSQLAGVYALFLISFFAKESAVNAVLLLGALWWWHAGKEAEPPSFWRRLYAGARLLGPFALLTGIYAGLHGRVVHDVYRGYTTLNYHFVAPPQAVRQTLFAYNHLLMAFYNDPVVLPLLPPLQAALRYWVEHILLLPIVLAAVAWRGRDRLLGFGLLWILVSLAPVVWLSEFHTSRFYYLPAVGSALILARGAQWGWRCSGAPRSAVRPLRLALPIGFAYLLLANLSLVTLFCLHDREDSQRIVAAFQALQAHVGRVPPGSLVVVRNMPASCFVHGTGLPDMVRMALKDQTAQGVLDGQRMPEVWIERLNRIQTTYVLDLAEQSPALRRLTRAKRARHGGEQQQRPLQAMNKTDRSGACGSPEPGPNGR